MKGRALLPRIPLRTSGFPVGVRPAAPSGFSCHRHGFEWPESEVPHKRRSAKIFVAARSLASRRNSPDRITSALAGFVTFPRLLLSRVRHVSRFAFPRRSSLKIPLDPQAELCPFFPHVVP